MEHQSVTWGLCTALGCGVCTVSFDALLAATNEDSYGIAFNSCFFADLLAFFSPPFVLLLQACGSMHSDSRPVRVSIRSTTQRGKPDPKPIAKQQKIFGSRFKISHP